MDTLDAINRLRAFYLTGSPTEDFLGAVIANDLQMASVHADDTSWLNLRAICGWKYSNVPSMLRALTHEEIDEWSLIHQQLAILERRQCDPMSMTCEQIIASTRYAEVISVTDKNVNLAIEAAILRKEGFTYA